MAIVTMRQLLEARVHFGHQTSRWHPKMKDFIYTDRNNVHVIDLEKTQAQLELVLPEIKKMAAEGKQILFVSTKPQAREVVKAAAMDCGMPFLTDRWLGGMLTNFAEIKKLVKKYNTLKEEQRTGELEKYTKKEQLDIAKELEKMDIYLGGIAKLDKMPDALFLPAMQREKTAVIEANRMHVPILAVCDTNANPLKADWVIPANDDAVNAIKMIVNLVAEAVKEGKAEAEKNKGEVK